MDKDVKVVRPTVKGSKVKIRTISNGKNNSVYVFNMDRDAKVFTVTSLSDLALRGQRSKVTAGLFVFYGTLVLAQFISTAWKEENIFNSFSFRPITTALFLSITQVIHYYIGLSLLAHNK